MKLFKNKSLIAISLITNLLSNSRALAHTYPYSAPKSENEQIVSLIKKMNEVDLAVDVKNNRVFVQHSINSDDHTVFIVDSKTQEVINKIPLSKNLENYTHHEIELLNGDTLLVLSSDNQNEAIVTSYKLNKNEVTEVKSYTLSYKDVTSMHVEANGNVSFLINDDSEEKLIITQVENNSLKTIKEIANPSDTMIEVKNIEASSVAETKNPNQTSYQSGMAAGFTAGLLSGLGFAYKQFFGNGWGMAIGFGGISQNGGEVDANIGAELMRILDEKERVRFYALFGVSSFYSRYKEYDYSYPSNPEHPDYQEPTYHFTNEASYNFGVGLGIEWAPAGFKENGVSFSFELPFAVSLLHKEAQGVSFNGIKPIPSVSIVYYFKHKK